MDRRFLRSAYLEAALARAVIAPLGDGTFVGRVPGLLGLLAFAESAEECRVELRSVLEGWIELGLRLGHPIPVVAGLGLEVDSTPSASTNLVRRPGPS